MRQVIIFLSLLVVGFSCRRVKISNYPIGESIRVFGSNYQGYIFDENMTTPWMMAQKEVHFSAYWWLNECEIPFVERCLQEYVTNYLDDYVGEHLNHYWRQYFPFISKNGHQMVHITLSELPEGDTSNEEVIENLGVRYRSVFDGREHAYYSILLDYSNCRRSYKE